MCRLDLDVDVAKSTSNFFLKTAKKLLNFLGRGYSRLLSPIFSIRAYFRQATNRKVLFILEFAFSLCRGENEKWAEPLLISLLGLCFGGNRQRLLRHFRRLKHEPVREKAKKRLKTFSLAFLLK